MNESKTLLFRAIDMACILIALAVSAWLMLPLELEIFADYTGASTFTLLSFFLSFYMLDCYAIGREGFRDSAIRVIVAVCIGIIGTGFIFYTFEHWRFPRAMFVIQMGVALFLTIGWRYLYYRYAPRFEAKPERVLLLGATTADRVRHFFAAYRPSAEIIGYTGEPGAAEENTGPWLGEASKTLQAIREHTITRLLVLDAQLLDDSLSRKLFKAKVGGLKVDDMRTLYQSTTERLPVDFIEYRWLLLEQGFALNADSSMRRLKRICDVGFSLFLLTLTAPILLISALLVRLESKGDIIYTQKRVGLGLKEFTVYKIRSMRQDAEKDGAVWAQKGDMRVTRVGRFIRKTRIDELPQLINVLKGDMSLIGPRPERMEFVKELAEKLPYYNLRHTVRPGVTGWAQVCYPYGASLEDARAKLEYDLYYIKNLSPLLEAKIVLKTIGVVLFPTGAR